MKLSKIAEVLACEVSPEAKDLDIENIASVGLAQKNSITFLSDPKYKDSLETCLAPAVIVKKGVSVTGKTSLEVDDPYLGYALVAQLFEDTTPIFGTGVHPTAIIDSTAKLESSVCCGPGSVVGKDCRIGKDTILGANVVIEPGVTIGNDCRIDSGTIVRRDCQIGNRVIIQSGSIIGSEGFGNALNKGVFVRIPCFGTVVIEDEVEIGANVTIDRGNFEPTIIKKGVRIDNLVQIAHNVEVGENTAMAAQVGISGSTKVGKGVLLAGQAGFVGHITIGDGAFVGAKAGVSKSVAPGEKVTGYPARDLMKTRRIEAAQLYLPQIQKEVKRLRKEIEALKQEKK